MTMTPDEITQFNLYREADAAGLLLWLPVPLGATVWRVRDKEWGKTVFPTEDKGRKHL